MITYQLEEFNVLLDDAWDMFLAHWEEVGTFADKIDFFINEDTYYQLELAGAFKAYTVRDDGVLVGYCTVIIHPHPHSRSITVATSDSLYLKQDHRKWYTASKLLDFVEKDVENYGVKVVTMGSTVKNDFSKLLQRKGYIKTEVIHKKFLGD